MILMLANNYSIPRVPYTGYQSTLKEIWGRSGPAIIRRFLLSGEWYSLFLKPIVASLTAPSMGTLTCKHFYEPN
jgi:hypothetical protein